MALVQIGTNTKLGEKVGAVSLPPLNTCPGKTAYCSKVCYATKGFFRFANAKNSLAANLITAEGSSFIDEVLTTVRKRKLKTVRIHPAGDFYSAEYIDKWINIVKSSPDVTFWAYTRSWRIPELVSKLKELHELPNIQMFASIDDTHDDEPPLWLRRAAVAKSWDNYDSTYVKCPNQKNASITCAKCTYCFKPTAGKKVNVVFKEH